MKLSLLLTYGWVLLGLTASPYFVEIQRHSFFHHNELYFPAPKGVTKTEENFHETLDALEEEFRSEVKRRGGVLVVKRNWQDSTSNAYAWREGKKYHLEFPGGMARYPGMSIDGFALIACHEMGHLLGGFPSKSELSAEGQSDYFATLKCMRKILPYIDGPEVWYEDWMNEECSLVYENEWAQNTCLRSLVASLHVAKIFARYENGPEPSYFTPETEEVLQTNFEHPNAQCRFDSFVAGALCPADPEAPELCTREEWNFGYRPACWYRP